MADGVSDLSRDKKLILHANGSVMLNLLQQCCKSLSALHANEFVMVALCNRETIYIFMLWFVLVLLLSSFFSSPNLSGRRLDVYYTSTHDAALVRI